jgi:fructan beta-fructosidase
METMEKSLTVTAEYLVLPVRNAGNEDDEGRLRLVVDGRTVLDYGIRFATGPHDVDWYAFFSLARFRGKQALVSADNVTEQGFALVRQTDAIPGADTFYTEPLRPQFHFTSRTGWLNDPNGLIWYRGEYHLFYQHNPTALPWGNMTWGHATSRDLVRWSEQPKVLFPDAATGTCFSGAAFIDHRNQLGRKTGAEDVIVAFYLRTEIGLCLAYSNDRGRTFTDYEHNPVLNHEGARIDTPRPFWHEPTGRWVAPTYDFFTNARGQKRRCVGFYSSANLTDWRFESRVEQDGWGDELCGCVDFFQLPLDGDPERLMWVMILIDGSYIVGDFDGSTFFTLDGEPAKTEHRIRSLVIQGDYYATMTWHNMPGLRRVQITWMRSSGFYPGMPFNQQMTAPSELSLHSSVDGPRLRMLPVAELESLRSGTHEWSDVTLNEGDNPLVAITADLLDLEAEFQASGGSKICLQMRGHSVTYDADSETVSSCGTATRLPPIDGVIRLRILLDRASIEVYANDGRVYIPRVVFPEDCSRGISLTCTGGTAIATRLRVHELKSSWPESCPQ